MEAHPLDNVSDLVDLHKQFLPDCLHKQYHNILFQGAIASFHKPTIDSYLESGSGLLSDALGYAIRYENFDSFKHVHEKYVLSMYDTTYYFNAYINYLIELPFSDIWIKFVEYLAPHSNFRNVSLLSNICEFRSKSKDLDSIIKIILPHVQYHDCTNILCNVILGRNFAAIKAFFVLDAKNIGYDRVIYFALFRSTRTVLELLCSVPPYGQAFIDYVTKNSLHYTFYDENPNTFTFAFVYEPQFIKCISSHLDYYDGIVETRGIHYTMWATWHWIKPKRDFFKYYNEYFQSTLDKNRDWKFRRTHDSIMVLKSNLKSDFRQNVLKIALRPRALSMQMILI
jgi:hypothetical protein